MISHLKTDSDRCRSVTRNFRWLTTVASVAVGTHIAMGFSYTDGDLLLVFRKDGFNDVEFNLGPASQFLNQKAGTTVTVTNWDATVVTGQYLLSDGAKVALVGASSLTAMPLRAWVTDVETASTPTVLTSSQWQVLWSKIHAIGSKAATATGNTGGNSYVVSPTAYSSYTATASNAGSLPTGIRRLGGATAFNIESAIPATLQLVELTTSTISPKPAATVIGSLQLSSDGTLTFTTAGDVSPAPSVTITSIGLNAGTAQVTFPTVTGVNYRLRYAAQPVGSPLVWTPIDPATAGTGNPITLSDPSALGAIRFYSVESFK